MTEDVGATHGQTRGFLFADLRGYTDFVERRGDDAAAALLERYRLMVRAIVARHAGAEVKTEGDSFYVLFPSASSAVTAALDIVASAAAESAEHTDAPIRVGVGVHAGETSDLPEGPVGSAVNMAARICAQAAAGEVLVSDTVRGLTRTRNVAVFASVGNRRLKGITEPVLLYRAAPPGTAISGASRRAATRSLPMSWVGIGVAILVLVPATWIIATALGSGSQPTPGPTNTSAAHGSSPSPSTAAASPSLAPVTGTRIIYSRQIVPADSGCNGVYDAKLYVIDPEHGDEAPYRLTHRSNLFELNPAWSADGSSIGFLGSVGRGPTGVYATDPQGSTATIGAAFLVPAMDNFGSSPLAVSPDGSTFVHAGPETLWRTPAGGSPSVQIGGPVVANPEDEPPPPTELFRDVAYGSDGSLLVLLSSVAGDEPWLEIMSDHGESRQRVNFDIGELNVIQFALGADDDLIALVIGGETDSAVKIGRLSEGPASLRDIEVRFSGPSNPSFSPDGDSLALQGGAGPATEIYVIDVQSGESSAITNDPDAIACSPAWHAAPANLLPARPAPAPGELTAFELGVIGTGPVLNEVVDPPMLMTFPPGWASRRSYVDGWSVYLPGEVYGEVDYARLQFGNADACGEDALIAVGSTPAEILAGLQGRSDLVLENAGPINLGGYSGIIVNVSGKEGEGCDPEFPYWALFRTAEDGISLGENEHLRLVSLDVDGAPKTFLIFAFAEDIDSYWTDKARPLLETISFPE